MVILRLIGLILVVAALMLLGADLVTTAEQGGAFMVRSLAQALALVGADPTNWIETTLPSWLAGMLTAVLSWPGWAVTGVPGVLLWFLFGRKE